MIVFVAEDVDAISNLQEEMDEDLGQLSGRDAGGQSQLRGYQRSDFLRA